MLISGTSRAVPAPMGIIKINSNASAASVPGDASRNLQLPIYSREQVSWHANCDSCWIIINDLVYDVTQFLKQHPGGGDVLLENAGADCTEAFKDKGHSGMAHAQLTQYLVGRLPERKLRRDSECSRSMYGSSAP